MRVSSLENENQLIPELAEEYSFISINDVKRKGVLWVLNMQHNEQIIMFDNLWNEEIEIQSGRWAVDSGKLILRLEWPNKVVTEIFECNITDNNLVLRPISSGNDRAIILLFSRIEKQK